MILLVAPALPLHTAGKYVAAAYIVFFALILIYVAIMSMRLSRIQREIGDLLARFDTGGEHPLERDEALQRSIHLGDPELPRAEESARV